jgi:hypothetical protein
VKGNAAAVVKRVRPADGGIVWHAHLRAFECLGGCEDFFEIRKRAEFENPEFLATTRQMLVIDHAECWQFDDPQMARDARRYRKRKKLRQNLAAQRVSWRGR